MGASALLLWEMGAAVLPLLRAGLCLCRMQELLEQMKSVSYDLQFNNSIIER